MHFINDHLTTSTLKHDKNHIKEKNQFVYNSSKTINNECIITNQKISFMKHKSFSLANNLN
jgi:hypothetical protein